MFDTTPKNSRLKTCNLTYFIIQVVSSFQNHRFMNNDLNVHGGVLVLQAVWSESQLNGIYTPWFHNLSGSSGSEANSKMEGRRETGLQESVLSNSMRTVLSMGFGYVQVIEAYSIFGDDVDSMVCYLLETGDSSRRKGKATEWYGWEKGLRGME